MGIPIVRVRPPEQQDPVSSLSRIVALQQMLRQGPVQEQMQQQQLQRGQQRVQSGALELQEQQRAMQEQQTLRDAYVEANGDNKKFLWLARQKGVSPATVLKLEQSLNEQRAKLLAMDKDALDNESKRAGMIGQAAQAILGLPPEQQPQAYTEQVTRLVQAGVVPQDSVPQQYPGPEALKLFAVSSMSAQQQIEEARKTREETRAVEKANLERPGIQADAAKKQLDAIAQTLGPARSGAEWQARRRFLAAKVTPDVLALIPEQYSLEAAAAARELSSDKNVSEFEAWRRENPSASVAEYLKLKRMTIVNNPMPAAGGGTGGLSDEALNQAAERFAKTGDLPALGMGAAGTRTAIMNRAAQLFPKVDQAANQAEYRANRESLRRLQAAADAVEAFEQTALKNLDNFTRVAKPVIDTGHPWINKPLRVVAERGLGSTEVAAFNAARRVAINEIAKVVSNPNLSSVLSDTARREVEELHPEGATLAQLYRISEVLKQDMAARRQSYQEQISAIQNRLRGGRHEQQPERGAPKPMTIRLPSGRTVVIE